MRIPDFLVRQIYVAGSLRNDEGGFRLQARNAIGDGLLTGIGRISIDGRPIERTAITARREGDDAVYHAIDVSRAAPVRFGKGDLVTFHVAGETLAPGAHRLEVELVELNLGALSIGFGETVA